MINTWYFIDEKKNIYFPTYGMKILIRRGWGGWKLQSLNKGLTFPPPNRTGTDFTCSRSFPVVCRRKTIVYEIPQRVQISIFVLYNMFLSVRNELSAKYVYRLWIWISWKKCLSIVHSFDIESYFPNLPKICVNN